MEEYINGKCMNCLEPLEITIEDYLEYPFCSEQCEHEANACNPPNGHACPLYGGYNCPPDCMPK